MYKYLLTVSALPELFTHTPDVFITNLVFKLHLYLGFIHAIPVYSADQFDIQILFKPYKILLSSEQTNNKKLENTYVFISKNI